jgi:hypothetical protein
LKARPVFAFELHDLAWRAAGKVDWTVTKIHSLKRLTHSHAPMGQTRIPFPFDCIASFTFRILSHVIAFTLPRNLFKFNHLSISKKCFTRISIVHLMLQT